MQEYLKEVIAVLKYNIQSNREVARILLGMRWFCNDSPWDYLL